MFHVCKVQGTRFRACIANTNELASIRLDVVLATITILNLNAPNVVTTRSANDLAAAMSIDVHRLADLPLEHCTINVSDILRPPRSRVGKCFQLFVQ